MDEKIRHDDRVDAMTYAVDMLAAKRDARIRRRQRATVIILLIAFAVLIFGTVRFWRAW